MSSNVSIVASALDTVNKMLEHWSKTEPDKPAFIFRSPATEPNPRLVLTRRHLFTLASAYATILLREGVRQGDVVCNTLPNSPERLLTDLGVMLAGAVAMNGTFFLADGADFVEAVQKGGCVAVIGDPNIKSSPLSVLQKRLAYSVGTTVHCPDVPCLHLLLSVDCRADQDGHSPLLQQLWEEKESFVADVRPTDPAYVFTTSGSTGFSKLVLKSHYEYLLVGETHCQLMGLRPDDVVFNEDLLGWMVGAPYDFVARGVTRVMLTKTTPPSDYIRFGWEIITSESCTVALVLPVQADITLARNDLWEDLHPKLRLIMTCR